MKRLTTAKIIVMISVLFWLVHFSTKPGSCLADPIDPKWRFGIAAPYAAEGYDLASLNVGAFLDWRSDSSLTLPSGVEYIRVLRVSNSEYPTTLGSLPQWVNAYPGSTWIIGNEPDRIYYQDSITAEVYAERYYELATIIRNNDPTAKIGFGTVVQPTPIRIRYLERAYNRLANLSGGVNQASSLVDLWIIHAFILNEDANEWGAGIPVGFENDQSDAIKISILNYHDTHSIDILKQRVIAFRAWMASIGQKEKPLWITEYGSLFPPIDPPGTNYYNVSDEDTAAFMVQSFRFFLRASDATIGLSSDNNKLVQRWFWYSLNEHRDTFGGSLYDPDQNKIRTLVGDEFVKFTNSLPQCYIFLPALFK